MKKYIRAKTGRKEFVQSNGYQLFVLLITIQTMTEKY